MNKDSILRQTAAERAEQCEEEKQGQRLVHDGRGGFYSNAEGVICMNAKSKMIVKLHVTVCERVSE